MNTKEKYLAPELDIMDFEEQDELNASVPWYKENEIPAPTRPRP